MYYLSYWRDKLLPYRSSLPTISCATIQVVYLLYPPAQVVNSGVRLGASEETNYCLTAQSYLFILLLTYSESCLVDSVCKKHQATTLLLVFLHYLSFKEIREIYSSSHSDLAGSDAAITHSPPSPCLLQFLSPTSVLLPNAPMDYCWFHFGHPWFSASQCGFLKDSILVWLSSLATP